jgi:hypothetical protein
MSPLVGTPFAHRLSIRLIVIYGGRDARSKKFSIWL